MLSINSIIKLFYNSIDNTILFITGTFLVSCAEHIVASTIKCNWHINPCFQFLLIFRKAATGELQNEGLQEVYKQMHEVDVDKEGVKGAKHFFEAKVLYE